MTDFFILAGFFIVAGALIWTCAGSAPCSGLTSADIVRQRRKKAMDKSRRMALIEAKTEYYRAKTEVLKGKTDGL